MSVMGLFFIFIGTLAVGWLWREGVVQAPWVEEGEIPAYRVGAPRPGAAKVGLVVFLAVAACLFSLLSAAFFMRMGSPDWRAPPVPRILWVNTLVLMAGSLSLQFACSSANAGRDEAARSMLRVGAAATILFLAGQLWAWRQMIASGFYASDNPANAFFFLLTAAHSLHLAGGLVALSIALARPWKAARDSSLLVTVDLCALYWHFLLLVWILLFAMLIGWADDFGAICRRILS